MILLSRQRRTSVRRAPPSLHHARSVMSTEGGFTDTDTYGSTPTSPGGSIAHLGAPSEDVSEPPEDV